VNDLLPSWLPGATRDAVVAFLDAVTDVPVEDRFACFDNDGTLSCERPTYVQLDYFVDALRTATRPSAAPIAPPSTCRCSSCSTPCASGR
jgi:hypothetical protein